MVIRSVRNWQKDGLTINGIELSQEINPYICGQLISTRGQDLKNLKWVNYMVFKFYLNKMVFKMSCAEQCLGYPLCIGKW